MGNAQTKSARGGNGNAGNVSTQNENAPVTPPAHPTSSAGTDTTAQAGPGASSEGPTNNDSLSGRAAAKALYDKVAAHVIAIEEELARKPTGLSDQQIEQIAKDIRQNTLRISPELGDSVVGKLARYSQRLETKNRMLDKKMHDIGKKYFQRDLDYRKARQEMADLKTDLMDRNTEILDLQKEIQRLNEDLGKAMAANINLGFEMDTADKNITLLCKEKDALVAENNRFHLMLEEFEDLVKVLRCSNRPRRDAMSEPDNFDYGPGDVAVGGEEGGGSTTAAKGVVVDDDDDDIGLVVDNDEMVVGSVPVSPSTERRFVFAGNHALKS